MSKIYIDVREKFEFMMGHVKGAVNIPLGNIMSGKMPDDVSKHKNIVVYCRTGSRSEFAKQILDKAGYRNVVNGINQAYIESHFFNE